MRDDELLNIYANHHHRQLARYGLGHPRSTAAYNLRLYFTVRYYERKRNEGLQRLGRAPSC